MGNQYGALDLLGLANASFVCIGCEDSQDSENDGGADDLGAFIPEVDRVFNRVRNVTVMYQARVLTALTFPSISLGDDVDGYTVTGARIDMDAKRRVQLAVIAHQHVDGTGDHLVNVFSVPWPSFSLGYGCVNLLGGTIPAAGIQRGTWEISMGHLDDTDNVGDHLVGRSQGVRIAATLEAITDIEPTVSTDWKLDSFQKPRSQDGMYRVSVNAHKLMSA